MSMWSSEKLSNYTDGAESGNLAAQLFLGAAYAQGKVVTKSTNLAEHWLRKASQQGSAEAGYRLAMLLIAQGRAEGITLLNDLSSGQFAPASYELGNCYYFGRLVERDREKARENWSEGARRGHLLAKLQLLKLESQSAVGLKKPLYWARIMSVVLSILQVYLRNEHDIRLLGTI